jgi:hypothetical protein
MFAEVCIGTFCVPDQVQNGYPLIYHSHPPPAQTPQISNLRWIYCSNGSMVHNPVSVAAYKISKYAL